MARTLAQLPQGARITDYISLGVVAQWFPCSRVNQVLAKSGKTSRRRDLPAHVVVYYVLALYRQVSYRAGLRCLLEGLQVAPRSAQAAARGGQLGDLASPRAAGMGTAPAAARRASGSRGETPNPRRFLPSLAAGVARRQHFGCDRWEAQPRGVRTPGASRGASAFPQIRFVSLVENRTHVLFASRLGAYTTGEITPSSLMGVVYQAEDTKL